MIKKERTKPLKIYKLEALLRRIPSSHPKRKLVEEQLAKSMAGYRGEQAIDYDLHVLSDKNYLIYHDVRLKQNDQFFQLDTLLVSPYFLVILEVKNIKGTLYFDKMFQQFIRKNDEKEEGFPDPLLQVKRHRMHLHEWLRQHKLPSLPIQSLVVISKPSTIIKTSNYGTQYKNIIHSAILPSKLEEFENMFKTEILSQQQLQKLSKLIRKNHTPSNPDILKQFQIAEHDIGKGIHCPTCSSLPMKRIKRKWVCPHCKYSSKQAHQFSLRDYALLRHQTITNKQACDFLQLSSRHIATRLLTSMNLEHTGNTKGREYKLPLWIEENL